MELTSPVRSPVRRGSSKTSVVKKIKPEEIDNNVVIDTARGSKYDDNEFSSMLSPKNQDLLTKELTKKYT